MAAAQKLPNIHVPAPLPGSLSIKISESDKEKLLQRQQHAHDPLGDVYSAYDTGLRQSALFQEFELPQQVTESVISFLEISCSESTWKENANDMDYELHYDAKTMIKYINATVLLTPPKQTKLPSNAYILDRVRVAVASSVAMERCPNLWEPQAPTESASIFVGIYKLDGNKLQAPTDADVELIYSQQVVVNKDDTEFIISPNLKLACGDMSYMLYMAELDGNWASGCVTEWKQLPLSTGNLQYGCDNLKEYKFHDKCTVYEVFFRHV